MHNQSGYFSTFHRLSVCHIFLKYRLQCSLHALQSVQLSFIICEKVPSTEHNFLSFTSYLGFNVNSNFTSQFRIKTRNIRYIMRLSFCKDDRRMQISITTQCQRNMRKLWFNKLLLVLKGVKFRRWSITGTAPTNNFGLFINYCVTTLRIGGRYQKKSFKWMGGLIVKVSISLYFLENYSSIKTSTTAHSNSAYGEVFILTSKKSSLILTR